MVRSAILGRRKEQRMLRTEWRASERTCIGQWNRRHLAGTITGAIGLDPAYMNWLCPSNDPVQGWQMNNRLV